MSLAALRVAIETHLTSNFTTYPIKYENITFDTPNAAPWVACHIKRSRLPTPELNASSYEVSGLLILQVFTPLNSGLVESNSIVDALANLYNDSNAIAGLWLNDTEITDVGGSATWYQVNLSVPFKYIGV